ncbi:MAG: hypothetical protein M5R36_15540 [Deltaproteobacteria bacterium]|nr:hypothetical protein [Deltaproteobacteria bacterium]
MNENRALRPAFVLAAMIIFFVTAEVILRLAHTVPESSERLRFYLNPLRNAELYRFDPDVFWRPVPGSRATARRSMRTDGAGGA